MNDMTQSPVRFGPGSSLVGMVTNPGGQQAQAGVACLMLNMGANHRVGPRRINVKLAHALAARGIGSLRLDLGGVGDSEGGGGCDEREGRDAGSDLRTRAVRDLQAGMDMLESRLGIRQFVILGMCSGAEHAMSTAAADPRVVGISLFDGFAFPQRRARWERALRRALAAPAHPSFPGKARRWLQRHLLNAQPATPLPGFFTEDAPPAVTAAWFAATMNQLVERKVAVQLLYSGSLHVCDHDRDQLGPFRHEPFAKALHYEFMRDVDHTVCTAKGQQLFLRSVVDWVADRCFGTSPERRVQSRPAAGAERPLPAAWAGRCMEWTMLLLLPLCLHGCGIPGFSRPSQLDDAGQPASAGGRDSPQIAAITPQLIRTMAARQPAGLPPEVRQLFAASPAYTIGAGDVIGIVVYRHPELLPNAGAVIAQQSDPTGVSVAPGFIVDALGEISFPYIGRTRVRGLTEAEASELITRRIAPFVRDPLVSVRIQSFRSQRAYVEGEVRTPGLQIFTDVPMTLAEAISRAGSITPSGDRSRVTLTRGPNTVAIDLAQLQRFGLEPGGIALRNGDIVNVGNRDDSRVYVMGEALRQSALQMRNGRLSLNEAIGDAGGPDLLSSNPGQIYVIRNAAGDAGQEVFHLDAKNPVALALADRFELKPRDVVYIDPVPLVRWNRVVSLILPAAQVVNLGGTANRR